MNKRNRKEALTALAEAGRSLESLPKDLKAAVVEGRFPGPVMVRYLDLEKSKFFQWLIDSGGFKKKLLADDLFLAKVAIEFGGVGVTKTATEYESRRENFLEEIEIVISDEVMSLLTDFILACLPAPTASLRANLAPNAGYFAKSCHVYPDNASQIALHGSLFSTLGRFGAIMRDGAKLFAVGTASSLVGTALTNALMGAHNAVDHSAVYGLENVPGQSTGVAFGTFMVLYGNLRHQVPAGVIKQWFLDPILNRRNLFLSVIGFAVGTGHPFPGSSLYQVLSGVLKKRLLNPLLHQRKLIFGAIWFTVGTGHPFLGSLLCGLLSLVF